jgi:hypothetical protein
MHTYRARKRAEKEPATSRESVTIQECIQKYLAKKRAEKVTLERKQPPATNAERKQKQRAKQAGAYTRPLSAQPEPFLTQNTP